MAHEREMVYEYAWIMIIIAVIAGFIASLAYYSFALNVNPACKATLATPEQLEDFKKKAFESPVVEVAPGVYEVYVLARQFTFIPNEIVLQDPKLVKFYIVSEDVIHGFEVVGTNVNVMVFPGYIAEFAWEPPKKAQGEYLIVCNEYCGVGHQFMKAKLIIERSGEALQPVEDQGLIEKIVEAVALGTTIYTIS